MKDMGLRIHTQIFLYLNKRRCQQSCHIFCVYKYRKEKQGYPQFVIEPFNRAVDILGFAVEKLHWIGVVFVLNCLNFKQDMLDII